MKPLRNNLKITMFLLLLGIMLVVTAVREGLPNPVRILRRDLFNRSNSAPLRKEARFVKTPAKRTDQTAGERYVAAIAAREDISNPLISAGEVEQFILNYKDSLERPTTLSGLSDDEKVTLLAGAYSLMLGVRSSYGHPAALALLHERELFLRQELIRIIDQ